MAFLYPFRERRVKDRPNKDTRINVNSQKFGKPNQYINKAVAMGECTVTISLLYSYKK